MNNQESHPTLHIPAQRRRWLSWLVVIMIFVIAGGSFVFGIFLLHTLRSIDHHLSSGNTTMSSVSSGLQPTAPVPATPSPTAPMLGSANAPVIVIEFADFQCPFCRRFQENTWPQLKAQYVDTGKVKFYYENFVFLGDESQMAAEAAKCAQAQDKFWSFHDLLFARQQAENTGGFNETSLKKIARDTGLNLPSFNSCLAAHTYRAEVDAETTAATSFGVNATPTLFINGQKYEGALNLADYNIAIAQALQK